ncbi:MAG: bifunctional 5,10-methylenetetrahydrofolate dehydrogenase/5,10-methenyltetrahydrofolate cyclohydrolase [Clostridiales bacterium]|nr:bifunctional 5,10-methylenetetrahydrofolate dehydrogenase/5,10-methenyltetrahydrofolate cyclohydrolase [Clostridiales bacterium]
MAELLKGAPVVEAINAKIIADVAVLKEKGVSPTLAILRVGERPDDISYEKTATKRCDTVGVNVKNVIFPEDVDQATVMAAVDDLNKDAGVHGVLIFRPMPKHLDGEAVRTALDPKKDIDGITDGSLAGVFANSGQGFAPCTAQACIEILDHYGIECEGKRATIVGRSLVVGKPVAMMLMAKNATITTCHTRTKDLAKTVAAAEIVIVAAGKMETVTADYFSPGQIVIDVGINWSDEKGKLVGDVKFDEAEPIVGAITPVPGGVGTVTTSVSISHVVEAAKKSAGLA